MPSHVIRSAGICLIAATCTWFPPFTQQRVEASDANSETNSTQVRPAVPDTPELPPPTFSEVAYGDHPRQVLDFWKASSAEPTPIAFVIHGGAWRGGSKERVSRFVDVNKLLDAGISVVAINYRYVTQADKNAKTPPVHAPLHDAARAFSLSVQNPNPGIWTRIAWEPLVVPQEPALVYGLPFTTR